MVKIFRYNPKILLAHTIFFVFVSSIMSSLLYIPEERDLDIYIMVFTIIISVYLIYIFVGYMYLYFKYMKTRYSSIKEFINLLLTDKVFRTLMANMFSAFWAFIYGLFTHVMFLLSKSYFYIFVEEIYFLIALIKIYMIMHINSFEYKKKKIDNLIALFLAVVSSAVLICAIMIYLKKGTFTKYDILIYAYALYAFYALISGIYSFLKAYKTHNMVRIRFFLVKFGCAIFSMYVLMVCLLNQFSENPNDTLIYQLLGGVMASIAIFIIAIGVVFKLVKNSHYDKNKEKMLQ